MAEIVLFPRSIYATARPPKSVRIGAAVMAMVVALVAGASLIRTWTGSGPHGVVLPSLGLLLCVWVLWYAWRCRLEVRPGQIQFFGFLPSQPVPLTELQEITLVELPTRPGRPDRSHLRLRRRRSAGVFKLSMAWEGAEDVVEALERLASVEVRHEEAS